MRARLATVSARAAAALACGALALLALPSPPSAPRLTPASARAEEDWFAEFEAVCSRTQDAMTISSEELRALVARCDRLKPRIEALDPPRRKVYARRLQQCRELYLFVLESRGPA